MEDDAGQSAQSTAAISLPQPVTIKTDPQPLNPNPTSLQAQKRRPFEFRSHTLPRNLSKPLKAGAPRSQPYSIPLLLPQVQNNSLDVLEQLMSFRGAMLGVTWWLQELRGPSRHNFRQ